MENLLLYGPVFLPVVAAYFLWLGLRDSQKIIWTYVALGLLALLVVCFVAVTETVIDDWGWLVFVQAIFVIGAAVIAGLVLGWFLNWKKKWFALLIGVVFPVALLASISISSEYSSDAMIVKNGNALAQALDQYRANKGAYPQSLEELVPTYVKDLKTPQTAQGWLYTRTDDGFILGYVSWIDSLGTYSIRVYQSGDARWDQLECGLVQSTCPFTLAPTPTRTLVH